MKVKISDSCYNTGQDQCRDRGRVISRGAAQSLSLCFSSTDCLVSSLHSPLPQLASAFSDARFKGNSKADLSSQLHLSVQLFSLIFTSQKLECLKCFA